MTSEEYIRHCGGEIMATNGSTFVTIPGAEESWEITADGRLYNHSNGDEFVADGRVYHHSICDEYVVDGSPYDIIAQHIDDEAGIIPTRDRDGRIITSKVSRLSRD